MAISEFCKRVATVLKNLRISNNLSVKELSEKSGLSVYKILNIENFKHDIKFLTVCKLCEIYKISLRDFADMTE
ncbi:helix-turn-helix transcriptional regulator [bacterium]|nr:helix-turn-helix transcriptional regulator [bacterium]